MTPEEIKAVAVVGAGLMGHGIAQEFALAGYEVWMQEPTEPRLRQALQSIGANLAMLAEVGLVGEERIAPTLGRLHATTRLEEAGPGADLVIEAVFEDLALKQDVFHRLDSLCPEHTILASNSSSLMPSLLAPVTRRPDRVVGVHYFNPPYLVPAVEIIKGRETSERTLVTLRDLLAGIGKRPLVVRKEVPGFIANRLQWAMFREALSLVESGVAEPQDIDFAVKYGPGRRWAVAGPFEVGEAAGLDLRLSVATQIVPTLESSQEVPALLGQKVAEGHLGLKTGEGFYQWTPEAAEELKQRIARALVAMARWT